MCFNKKTLAEELSILLDPSRLLEREKEEEDGAKICNYFSEDISLENIPTLRETVLNEEDPKYVGQRISRQELEQEEWETPGKR